MEIVIAATKTCNFRPILEKELKDEGLPYKVKFFEDNPDLVKHCPLKTSPLLIVDDELVSIGMPEHKTLLELKKKL